MELSLVTKDGCVEVNLVGKFAFSDHQKVKRVIEDFLGGTSKVLIFNMKEVEYIDSAGLGMLLHIQETLEEASRNFVVRSPQGSVKKILEVSKFDQLITIEY